MSEVVIQATVPFVDVLSFQHFSTPDRVSQNLGFWHNKTGFPTLVADYSHVIGNKTTGYQYHTSQDY